MSATNKKKQDEEHLKILREMVSLAHNKHCFDCHQRGPTYLNMTIGSFICTSCSGILRGLNPPHRVKSISMASFTPDEMEFIKSRGNAFCQKVWLGLHDGRPPLGHETKDDMRMRDTMAQRYEKKRWYVQPTDSMYDEARRSNAPSPSAAATSRLSAVARPQTTSFEPQRPASTAGNFTTSAPISAPGAVMPPGTVPQPGPVVVQPPGSVVAPPGAVSSQSSIPSKFDLLADFGGDPFAAPTKAAAVSTTSDAFANFDAFASNTPVFGSTRQPAPAASLPGLLSHTVGGPVAPTGSVGPPPPVSADKYSALAELESAFSVQTAAPPAPPASVNWDSFSSVAASRNAAGSWGVSAAPTGGGAVFGTGAASSGLMYGGPMAPAGPTPTAANTAFAAPGGNPFGQVQHAAAAPVSNPFLTGTGQMYVPQLVPGAFSQPGPVPTGFSGVPASGVGHYVPVAGAGQYNLPNGGTMWATQAVMGHQQHQHQVPAQMGSWGPPTMPPAAAAAPAAANPFMSGMQQQPATRTGGVTNPFL